MDNLPIGLVILEKNNKILYKNKATGNIPLDNLLKKIEANDKNKENIYQFNEKYYSIKKIIINNKKLLMIADATETINNQRTMKQLEEKIQAISDNNLAGTAIIKNNQIQYINQKFGAILGYENNHLKNIFFDLIHPEDKINFKEILNGKSLQLKFFDKNKNIKWLELAGTKIPYDGGSYIVHAKDITVIKKTELKLKDVQKQMQDSLQRERKFLDEISHYFFNPLCIAKGYLDLTIPNAEPALKHKLEITRHAVTRVETIVKNIVNEGKIYEQ